MEIAKNLLPNKFCSEEGWGARRL